MGFVKNLSARGRLLGYWMLINVVFLGFCLVLILKLFYPVKACLQTTATVKPRTGFNTALRAAKLPEYSNSLQTAARDFLSSVLPQHRVKPGETLYSISRYYFSSLTALAGINQIHDPRSLQVGRVLLVPPVDFKDGRLRNYQLRADETIADILVRYNLDLWRLQRLNPYCDVKRIRTSTVIILPNKPADTERPIMGVNMIRPVTGFLTSRFGFRWGRMHYGLDLAAPGGAPVRAAAAGIVAFAGWAGSYGRYIKISHGSYYTSYAHLSVVQVGRGAHVNMGQQIGRVGRSGHAYGNHLHFEVESKGKRVNPYTYLF